MMFLLIGLGNPGSQYRDTRHNIGFMFLDYLASRTGVSFKGARCEAEIVKTTLVNAPVLLVKPLTYMNKSGLAVNQIAEYYKIPAEHVIVIHDDLDLVTGRIKIVFNRGAGGHNGIKSIIEHLGTKEFVRVRVGIGRPGEKMSAASYVLSRFDLSEQTELLRGFNEIEDAVGAIIQDGVIGAMTRVNAER
ncbi:MAG: aminoacyl-tRNA hydrolase [Proteobacteria bacterium]|nr:aminoacyl-tRNA hydrolase [Pseudomonadota bacterium]